jgi:hypothetical protein
MRRLAIGLISLAAASVVALAGSGPALAVDSLECVFHAQTVSGPIRLVQGSGFGPGGMQLNGSVDCAVSQYGTTLNGRHEVGTFSANSSGVYFPTCANASGYFDASIQLPSHTYGGLQADFQFVAPYAQMLLYNQAGTGVGQVFGVMAPHGLETDFVNCARWYSIDGALNAGVEPTA